VTGFAGFVARQIRFSDRQIENPNLWRESMLTRSRVPAVPFCSVVLANAAFRTFVVCFALILLTAAAFGQAASSISGTIKDPTGATVAKAVVTLTDDKTSAKRSALSSEAGVYTFTDIALGNYSVEASAQGFSVFASKITVGASPVSLDIPLELAQQAGQVSVEARIDPFNIVPTEPTQSLFGLDKSLEDTPRSISTADAETLTRYSVKTVNDLVTVAPGTFTGS
jgi:hypothetical protein